jgi:hypothetical protein
MVKHYNLIEIITPWESIPPYMYRVIGKLSKLPADEGS